VTKFLLDRMLGQTAKWLRLMGIDAEYASDGSDDDSLRKKAEREDRILVTRDKELSKTENGFLVPPVSTEEVLGKIISEFDIEIKPLTRCSKCNSLVRSVSKESVKDAVPDRVYSIQEDFWRCTGCGQIYWKGTHWEDILAKIERICKKTDESSR